MSYLRFIGSLFSSLPNCESDELHEGPAMLLLKSSAYEALFLFVDVLTVSVLFLGFTTL